MTDQQARALRDIKAQKASLAPRVDESVKRATADLAQRYSGALKKLAER